MVQRPSSVRRSIQLGRVQETALVPLYARALESRRRRPILEDPKAVEIVDSIDWDFRRFGQRRRVVGCTLRSAMFDVWVREFLRRHPKGTVVEIGAGLNTRFERLDNGTVHWHIGLHLVESRTVADVPDCLRPRLSLPLRATLQFFSRFLPRLMKLYHLNVFSGR
jgi:hypothetical protein